MRYVTKLIASGARVVVAASRHVALGLALIAIPVESSAFNTIGTNPGSKWDDPAWGTGAVITWSFMTPGVGLGDPAPDEWSGTNSLGAGTTPDIRQRIDDVSGTGTFDAAVRRAFATWSGAANLVFVEVPDAGGDFGTVTAPDIRIGAFSFAPGDLAGGAGFGPPGNDLLFPDALAGDIALNELNNFSVDPGNEGDALQTGPFGTYLNDIEGLLLHEIGHTLGLAHSDVTDGVMCGFIFPGDVFDGSSCDFTHVNRQLHADDISGIQAIYGAPVPVPAAVWLFGSGLVGLIGVGRRRGKA
jgi:hypothetical protein